MPQFSLTNGSPSHVIGADRSSAPPPAKHETTASHAFISRHDQAPELNTPVFAPSSCMHTQLLYNISMFNRCIYFNLNTLTRDINRIWDAAFKRHGLSPAHGYLLRAVLSKPGMTQKEIAEELSLDPSTVTRFIDALSARGMIERQPSKDNARESTIFPTKRGRALQDELENTGLELYKSVRKALGARRFDSFVKELRSVRAVISPKNSD